MTGVAGLAGDPANSARAVRAADAAAAGVCLRPAAGAASTGWAGHWAVRCGECFRRPGRGRGCNHCGPCGLNLVAAPCPGLRRPDLLAGGAGAGKPAWSPVPSGAESRRAGDGPCVGATLPRTPRTTSLAVPSRPPTSWCGARHGHGACCCLASATAGRAAGWRTRPAWWARNLMHHPTAIVTGIFRGGPGAAPAPSPARFLHSQAFYEDRPHARRGPRLPKLQALRGQGPAGPPLGGLHGPAAVGSPGTPRRVEALRPVVQPDVTARGPAGTRNRIHPGPVLPATGPESRGAARLPAVGEQPPACSDHGIGAGARAMTRPGRSRSGQSPGRPGRLPIVSGNRPDGRRNRGIRWSTASAAHTAYRGCG